MKRKSLIIALSILSASAILFGGLNKVNKVNNEPQVVLAEDPELEELRDQYKQQLHELVDENDYWGNALDELHRIISYGEKEIDGCVEEDEMIRIVDMVEDFIMQNVNEMQRHQEEHQTKEEELEEARKDARQKAIIETQKLGQYHTAYQEDVDIFLMGILDEIEDAQSIEEINAILEKMYAELASIPTMDRERIENILANYVNALNKYLRENRSYYSEEQYKEFQKIVESAINKIWACVTDSQANAIYNDALNQIRVHNELLGLEIDTSHLLDEPVDNPTEDPIDKKNGWLIATIIEGSVLVIALAGVSIILIRRRMSAK